MGEIVHHIYILLLGLAIGGYLLPAAGATVGGKPNILFIYTDDQSFDTIHALGNREIQTPNFDRLARAGVAFDNCYNQGAGMARFAWLVVRC